MSKKSNYITTNRSKHYLKCHLIFVCKYRKPMLVGQLNDDIKQIFQSIANASAFVDAAFSASFSAANSSASDFAAAASNFAAASATNAAADKKQNQKTTANICKEILGDLIISQVNFLLNED